MKQKLSRLILTVISSLVLSVNAAVAQDVLTQHNDIQRTGANLKETTLKPGNVNRKTFGLKYSRIVDGYIYAQPLYVSKDETKGRNLNLVIVATGENRIYAFDADTGSPQWETPRLKTAGVPDAFNFCPLTTWPLGVTSTPVIDPDKNEVFVVARKFPEGTHFLYRLDLKTGKELGSTEIKYAVKEGGPQISFEPEKHFNRAGLLLVNGNVYIGFAAMCDRFDSHGWLFSYNADTLQQVAVFCTTPKAKSEHVSGGIWQSGNGIACDRQHRYIFFMTGNGEFDLRNKSFSSSFIQLKADDLSVMGYFVPSNERELTTGDVDVGAGGPVLLRDDLLLGGGKQGRYYVLTPVPNSSTGPFPQLMTLGQNRAADMPDHMDGFQVFINTWHEPKPNKAPSTTQTLTVHSVQDGKKLGFKCVANYSRPCPFPQVNDETDFFQVLCAQGFALKKGLTIPHTCYGFNQYYGPNIHGGPLFWEPRNLVFGTAEKDRVKSFNFFPNGGRECKAMSSTIPSCIDFATKTVSDFRAPDGMPGGFLSLSADGATDGIIWASFPQQNNTFFVQPGRLIAFDAVTLKKIWSDDTKKVGFAKFCPPTVAGGLVFRAGFVRRKFFRIFNTPPGRDKGQLLVYGIREKRAK